MPPNKVRWWEWLFFALIYGAGIAIAVGALLVGHADSHPTEPDLKDVAEIRPHPSLGAVFDYGIRGQFTHAKKGAIEHLPPTGVDYILIFPDLNEVWWITSDGIWYTFWMEADFYFDDGQFVSMVGKTWPPCGCGEWLET